MDIQTLFILFSNVSFVCIRHHFFACHIQSPQVLCLSRQSTVQPLLTTRRPVAATTHRIVESLVRFIGPVASSRHLHCRWSSVDVRDVPRKGYVTLGPPFRDTTSNWGIVGGASADHPGCTRLESLGTRPSTTKQNTTTNYRVRGICGTRTRRMPLGWVDSDVIQ